MQAVTITITITTGDAASTRWIVLGDRPRRGHAVCQRPGADSASVEAVDELAAELAGDAERVVARWRRGPRGSG